MAQHRFLAKLIQFQRGVGLKWIKMVFFPRFQLSLLPSTVVMPGYGSRIFSEAPDSYIFS